MQLAVEANHNMAPPATQWEALIQYPSLAFAHRLT